MTAHGKDLRGEQRVPLSPINEGRFGRMFRRLPPAPHYDEGQLAALAELMHEAVAPPSGGWNSAPTPQPGGDNPAIPAAYTYLGQFIDHDITFDPNSSLQQQNDPDALQDFRTPRYDLDSLYGSGPADEPFQYVKGSSPERLLVEANTNGVEDLPRTSQGFASSATPATTRTSSSVSSSSCSASCTTSWPARSRPTAPSRPTRSSPRRSAGCGGPTSR
jgi:hypothetical protein